MARRHVERIVRTEIPRRVRIVRGDDQRLGGLILLVPIAVVGLPLLFVMGVADGQSVQAGEASEMLDRVGTYATVLFAYGAGLLAFRGIQLSDRSAADEWVRIAAGHREVVHARLLLEGAVAFGFVGLPGVIGGLGFALGTGSPATAVLVVAAVLSMVALATVFGVALAFGIRTAIARSRFVSRHRTAIAVFVLVGYLLVLHHTGDSRLSGPILDALRATPLVWFADLALLAVWPGADALKAGAIVVLTGVGVTGCTAVNSRLAATVWYSKPVEPEPSAGRSLPSPRRLDRPRRVIVRKTWTRAIRSPLRLIYVGYGGLLIGFLVANSIRFGSWPPWVAPVVALFGAWATGAGFALNPIGEEGPILSMTLTAPITGRQFVEGLWLASAIPGIPVTLALTIPIAVASGFGIVDLVLVVLFGAGLAAFAPGLASGIGAVFPQTEAESITRNRAVVVPHYLAFLLYSMVLFAPAVPGLTAIVNSGAETIGPVTLPPGAVRVLGTSLSLLAVAAVAVMSYRFAGARFGTYRLE